MAGEANGTIRITHFRVERELGRDALGYVFEAIDEQLERRVALRVVRASARYGDPDVPEARERFRAAARRAAALNHPNLVTIHEFRALAETDLVAMELVGGETLAEMRARGVRWTVLDAARLLARLADALAAAHDAGLVHGHIHDGNVRVRPDGRIKLLDLGIPKDTDELAPPPTVRDDLRGLARVACRLLAPAAPDNGDDAVFGILQDPVMSRARYGFLAPVLARAIAEPLKGGFASAAEFRDALVVALDAALQRAAPDAHAENRWSTRVIGPDRTIEDRLPDARALSPIGRVPVTTGRRRLVLPHDLAEGSPAVEDDLTLPPPPPSESGATKTGPGPKLAIAAVIVLAVGAAGWLGYQRWSGSTPAAAMVPEDPMSGLSMAPLDTVFAAPPLAAGPADSGAAQAAVDDDAGTGTAESTAPPPRDAAGLPALTAMVRGAPDGTTIAVAGDAQRRWTDAVELSVAPGDTILLTFSRPGYVTRREAFTGERISVSLIPDSVVATFRANVSARVFVGPAGNERALGSTPLEARLPSGSHRITFRSPGQPDWTETHAMTQPGRRYAVAKEDYVTVGDLVITVDSTWAQVTIDGGPPRETPARFNGLAVGPHVVRLVREGFQTIVDTVMVSPGDPVTRRYTLRR